MKEIPVQEEHYGEQVWVNPTCEPMRREECMCLHCGMFAPGTDHHCPAAGAFYKICCEYNVAFIVTRCRIWKPRAA